MIRCIKFPVGFDKTAMYGKYLKIMTNILLLAVTFSLFHSPVCRVMR